MRILKRASDIENKLIEQRPFLTTLVLLLLLSSLTMSGFLFGDRLFVITGDTFSAFIPEANSIMNTVTDGSLPMWSFYKGLGQQITVGNPNWTGDIFTIFSMLFGTKLFPYLLALMMFLKIILSGLFFYQFLKELQVRPYTRILFSLLYAFNGHMICRGIWLHYATEVVFVALWLWTLELYCNGKRKFAFPIGFAILLLPRSAAYVFIYSLLSFAYIILRRCFTSGFNVKDLIGKITRFAPYYLLGIGLSSVLLLPGIYAILNSSRLEGTSLFFSNPLQINDFLSFITVYVKSFSNSIMGAQTTTGPSAVILEDPILYCGILTILLFPQIFTFKNTHKREKITILFMLSCVALYYIFPYLRYFLNAFATTFYKTSSFWTIVVVLLVGIFVFDKLERREEALNGKTLTITCLVYIALFVLLCFNDEKLFQLQELIWIFCAITVWYIILISAKNHKLVQYAFIAMVCVELIVTAWPVFYSEQVPYVEKEKFYSYQGMSYDDGTKKTVEQIRTADTHFFRITTPPDNIYNKPQAQGYFGTSMYASLTSKRIIRFYDLFEVEKPNNVALPEFNKRNYLNKMLSVKYFLSNRMSEDIPQDYQYVFTGENGIRVYENKNFLPFGFVYHRIMSEKELSDLPSNQKDYAVMNAVILNDAVEEQALNDYNMKEYAVKAQEAQEVTFISAVPADNTVAVEQKDFPNLIRYRSIGNDPQIMLMPEMLPQEKQYELTMTVDSSIDTGGQIYLFTEDMQLPSQSSIITYQISRGENTYKFDMGDMKGVSYIRLDVGDAEGEYSIRDFKVSYIDKMPLSLGNELRDDHMVVERFSHNNISGTIDMSESGFLFLSIPYDDGWQITVDGAKNELVLANGGFSGLLLNEGDHTIELRYVTPWLIPGTIVTGMSVIALTVLILRKKGEIKLGKQF